MKIHRLLVFLLVPWFAVEASGAQTEAELKNHVQYYEVELDRKSVHLTHEGIAAAQESAGVGSLVSQP
jgi:preprotein translocase subunit SecA